MDNERPSDSIKLATVDGLPASSEVAADPPKRPARRRPGPKKHPAMRGRKGWNPTKRDLRTIELCRAAGMTPDTVAAIIGVSKRTLTARAHDAVMNGAAAANSKVVSKLYEKCMKGDTIALLFWCKTRLGWQEKSRVEHSGPDGGTIRLETVEAEANDFTARILAMASRFAATAASNDAEAAPAEGSQTANS